MIIYQIKIFEPILAVLLQLDDLQDAIGKLMGVGCAHLEKGVGKTLLLKGFSHNYPLLYASSNFVASLGRKAKVPRTAIGHKRSN